MGSIGKGSSNVIKGVNVQFNNQTFQYQEINGAVYEMSGVNPRPINLTLKEIENHARTQNFPVTLLTSKDLALQLQQKNQQREQANKILNQAYVSDKTFVKGSRASRITNRANKRNK